MSYVKRKEILVVIFCLLIGFALRFYTFDRKSLWIDEIHTFNDSRDDIRGQLNFYKENPSYLHPPLFFILTHQFYPFYKAGKRPPYHSLDLWNPFHPHDLSSCETIFSAHCPPLHFLFNLHGLPHQPLSGWTSLFTH